MRIKLTILILFCMINIDCFSQSYIFQLLYDSSIKEYNVNSNSGAFISKKSQSADFICNVMGSGVYENFAIAGGGAFDVGLKFYDFSNAYIHKKTLTRFEIGAGLSGSMQVRYKRFWNGITVGALPVLLFSGWTWGEIPQVRVGLKLTADVNISIVNVGICYYPFKQKVHTKSINYYFEPNLMFRVGVLISHFE